MNINSFLKKLSLYILTVPSAEKIFFTQNLALLVKSGVNLRESLQALAQQVRNKYFQTIIKDIADNVEQGNSLSKSLEKYPKIFPEMSINMIKAGEESGRLEEVLFELSHQQKSNHRLKSQIRGALVYPIIVSMASVIMITGMLIFVIPKIKDIFAEYDKNLPIATRVLIFLSNLLLHQGIWVFLILIVLIIIVIKFLKSKQGKYYFDWAILHLPIVGSLSIKINLVKFSRSLSALIKTDIPIVKSFRITGTVLNNSLYKNALITAGDKISKGDTIANSLKPYKNLFPTTLIQIILTGEKTGKTDEILEQTALFYDEELNNTLEQLPKLLEPLLLIGLGIGVGFIAIAILMPLYSLSRLR